nr:MAG TPA: hypothetical protein [Caudoviricetes sp.]
MAAAFFICFLTCNYSINHIWFNVNRKIIFFWINFKLTK